MRKLAGPVGRRAVVLLPMVGLLVSDWIARFVLGDASDDGERAVGSCLDLSGIG